MLIARRNGRGITAPSVFGFGLIVAFHDCKSSGTEKKKVKADWRSSTNPRKSETPDDVEGLQGPNLSTGNGRHPTQEVGGRGSAPTGRRQNKNDG